MKYEELVKMGVKDLRARLKELNTQAQTANGEALDALLEEANTITGILNDARNRQKLAGIAENPFNVRRNNDSRRSRSGTGGAGISK